MSGLTGAMHRGNTAFGVVMLAMASACLVRDVPAGAEDCSYRCTEVCPPGFECRGGFCVRPGFESTCTSEGEPDTAKTSHDRGACAPGEGTLSVAAAGPAAACSGQELALRLEASGGEGPFLWSLSPATPEVALEETVTRRTRLRGAFRNSGSLAVTVRVRDAQNCGELVLPINVSETPAIRSVFPEACAGEPFQLELSAVGGDPGSYAWAYAGEVPLEQSGSSLRGRAPSAPGLYPVRLSLRDDACPADRGGVVSSEGTWRVTAGGECPTIVTSALPAACPGVEYSQPLRARDGSGEGYIWSLLSGRLPDGLTFDGQRGVVHGTPTGITRGGALDVQLTDSRGRSTTALVELSLRDDCRMAWIADEPARLHVGDVLSPDAGIVLPRDLAPEAAVRELRFSPDGRWIAFRAGIGGEERLYLYSLASPAPLDARRIDFVCPDASACAVLDYAWSRDSLHLAAVLGGGASDFVSGITISQADPLSPWPVLGTAVVNGSTEVALDYFRDLAWAPGDRFGFVGASGGEVTPHTVFVAQAGLGEAPQSIGYYDSDLRLRQTPTGWVAFDAFYYTATSLVLPDRVAVFNTGWVSPSAEYVGTVQAGALSIFSIDDDGAALAATESGVCPVVVAWAPRARGVERIACGSGSVDAPDGGSLRVFDFDVERRVFDPPGGRAMPLNGAYTPAALTNTRRVFSPSADWLLIGPPQEGVAILPIPWGTPGLPRASAVLSVAAPAELRFAPDGQSLIVYDQSDLRHGSIPPGPQWAYLSYSEAGPVAPAPNLTSCEEALWASPDNWCGAPETQSHFIVSHDSSSALFEGADGLWWVDLSARPNLAARRIAAQLPGCGGACAGLAYAFQP